MRSGCTGVAIGCAGIASVIDARGRPDLFGRPLEVTKQALADNIASAAEIVMGEADECTPAAIIRGLGIPITGRGGHRVDRCGRVPLHGAAEEEVTMNTWFCPAI